MTVQDLGSVGELIAAIVTVATLIYLPLQTANTTALRVEARRSEMQGASAYTSAIIGSSDVARILNAGLVDPMSLPAEEVTRFSFLMGNFLGAEAAAFDEVLIGFAPRPTLDRRRHTLSRFLLTPGGRWLWERFSGDQPPEFRSYVEKILRDDAASGA